MEKDSSPSSSSSGASGGCGLGASTSAASPFRRLRLLWRLVEEQLECPVCCQTPRYKIQYDWFFFDMYVEL